MTSPAARAAQAPLDALTITGIEQIPLVVPLGREYKGSYYSMTHRVTVLTRIHTSEGLIGTAYAADEENTVFDIMKVVEHEIAPRLIGQNALAIERCWELAYPVTFDQLRDRRIGLVALAGVDTAIWDLFGQVVGRPLYEVWGGYRNRLPVNIIGGYYGPVDEIRGEVEEWLEMGFRGCKFKIGSKPVDEDAARVRMCRETVGDDFVITIDANQGYTLPSALALCDRVRELDIRWFEEPCRWANDARDMREVRARGGIPVCAGQSEYSPEGCRDLMDAGAIDVCNFDSSWAGGPTNWRRNAAVAHVYSVELAHHEEPHVAAHLLASQPKGTYLEVFHPDRDPIWWQLVLNRPEVTDGEMELPSAPGLGWEYDTDFIEKYRADR
ncbi:MAG: mandelate racemase/muconate lactonizing enzyme family protein [Actinobacteria bacterium]|nr:mandelate racemase/muconate lactonizing enzyme family protein [Actinomycetota bacterium]